MRRAYITIPVLMLGLLLFYAGCERKIKGPERENIPPTVDFVNIPVEGAYFSSDTTVFWYGSDIDGFITTFRYAVIKESEVGDNPQTFIDNGGLSDTSSHWINIPVDLDNTGTRDRVQMSADVSDPVRTYVKSYIFLQAIDNLGARSQIAYRYFFKNNHFPNTRIYVRGINDPYVNALSPGGVLEGVVIRWDGEDRIDYPRNPPPFQYRWKVFGPFNDSVLNVIDSAYVCSVFVDIFGDFYRSGDTLRVFNSTDTTYTDEIDRIDTLRDDQGEIIRIDTLFVIDEIDTLWNEFAVDDLGGGNPYGNWQVALLGITPKMDSLALHPDDHGRLDELTLLQEELVDSSLNWSYDLSTNVYDLFRYEEIPAGGDTTRQLNFVAWVQSRDDAQVPDIVPAFEYISVIEPKFEREVVVVDAAAYDRISKFNWPIFPRPPYAIDPISVPPVMRDVMGEFVNNWKPGSFDAENILPDDSIYSATGQLIWVTRKWRNGTTQDYYPIRAIDSYLDGGQGSISLREVLKHKIALYVKDNTSEGMQIESLEGLSLIDGINAGMNCWLMARAAAGESSVEEFSRPIIHEVYRNYFGIGALQQSSWQERVSVRGSARIEDFIGADPESDALMGQFPTLMVDTLSLETLYLWEVDSCANPEQPCYPFRDLQTGEIITGAIPEVGFVQKQPYAEAIYLYKSLYGGNPPTYIPDYLENRDGTVVGIRSDTPYFRTAFFCFTLLAMDNVTAQQVFNNMMDWLAYQPFLEAGKINHTSMLGMSDVTKYRSISRRLHALKKQGLLPPVSQY